MAGRDSLRATFDEAAAQYHRARPRYPATLLERVVEVTGIGTVDRALPILEIGPATGVATEFFASTGQPLTAVELGEDLAAEASTNLADFDNVQVVHDSFDTWEPPAWRTAHLVFAATAWHWLDSNTKYHRAHRHLTADGHLAFWSANHVIPHDGDNFFAAIQPVYDEVGESLPDGWKPIRPGQLPEYRDEIDATGLFTTTLVEHFDWELTYTAEQYIDLLRTFSGHIAMPNAKRNRLFEAIRDLLDQRSDKRLRRHWGAVLHVAQPRGAS